MTILLFNFNVIVYIQFVTTDTNQNAVIYLVYHIYNYILFYKGFFLLILTITTDNNALFNFFSYKYYLIVFIFYYIINI